LLFFHGKTTGNGNPANSRNRLVLIPDDYLARIF
jgi:hypothetical protein